MRFRTLTWREPVLRLEGGDGTRDAQPCPGGGVPQVHGRGIAGQPSVSRLLLPHCRQRKHNDWLFHFEPRRRKERKAYFSQPSAAQ